MDSLPADHDWPDAAELAERAHVLSLPMRVRFRGIDVREVVLIKGPAGWGEFSPFVEYDDIEASRWLASALESAWIGWPSPVRDRVPVNATVPAVRADRVGHVLAHFDGCTTAKVKVAERGQELADDLSRVAAVREVMGAGARIRVDANGAWSVDDAVRAVTALSAYGLEYVEQPCRTVEELAEVRLTLAHNGVDVPVAADESIRRAEDPFRVARLGAADIAVVKVAPLGGVRAAREIVQECGLPAVVSSAIDSSVGIVAGVALAASLPSLEHACGLGTVSLLQADVCSPGMRAVGGMLAPGRVEPDPESLRSLAAAPERQRLWRDRLRRCYAYLRNEEG